MMSGTTEQRERELKFDVPSEWELAEPAELVPPGGRLDREVIHLESTYYDTAEHELLRAGLTLRRRTGDADTGWQLKVPSGDARTEIRHDLNGRGVPQALRELVRGASGGGQLLPVATIATDRALVHILSADASELAEIAVDSVTATRRGSTVERTGWREVEIELHAGDEAFLRRAAKALRRQGARPARTGSKLARALGPPPMPARSGLAALVGDYLDAQRTAILRGDVDLRRGLNAIHRTRVGTRRYRSVLRVFADVLDTDRAAALDTELRWYAQVLGEVRDRHVMREHLDAQLAQLPPELVLGPVAARIHSTLDAELATAGAALQRALRSKRYLALVAELNAWHDDLPVVRRRKAASLERYVRTARTKVDTRLSHARAIPPSPEHDLAMHRARKAAKRARYTAELAEPLLGRAAAKVVEHMKSLQDDLGERQDGTVAAAFLRRLGAAAGTTPGENGFTFGVLAEQERARTRAADSAAR